MTRYAFRFSLRRLFGIVFAAALLCGIATWVSAWLQQPDVLLLAGDPPIVRAAAMGDLDEVERLLDYRSQAMFDKDKTGRFAIHRAIRCGHHQIAVRLIERGYPLNWARGDEDPIIFSCLGLGDQSLEMLQYLLECGANPNVMRSSDGTTLTPMHVAVQGLNFEGVRILWQHGGRFDLADPRGMTAEEMAVKKHRVLSDASLRLPHGENVLQSEIDELQAMVQLIQELSSRERPTR